MSGARPQRRPICLHGQETANFTFFIDTVECVYASVIMGVARTFSKTIETSRNSLHRPNSCCFRTYACCQSLSEAQMESHELL